jgi:hypothetical protein
MRGESTCSLPLVLSKRRGVCFLIALLIVGAAGPASADEGCGTAGPSGGSYVPADGQGVYTGSGEDGSSWGGGESSVGFAEARGSRDGRILVQASGSEDSPVYLDARLSIDGQAVVLCVDSPADKLCVFVRDWQDC